MHNPFSLSGKTILVVGASSGIGQSTAVECSKMGANVVLVARSEAGLQETVSLMTGDEHKIIVADITSDGDIAHIVGNVISIDGVVLSAGKGLTLTVPFCTRDKYDEVFNINFFAQVELVRLLYKKKKIAKEGSIVFISSIGGIFKYAVGSSIYGASKAAINSTMKYYANEFAARKIRVNSINPGMVQTKLIMRGTLTEEDHKRDMETYPLKRYGKPEEIAYGAVYLLSDAASWITGHSLVIDGGVTAK